MTMLHPPSLLPDVSKPPIVPAINCTNDHSEVIGRYVRASLSQNSIRAYRSDLLHFETWGGSIPTTAETVAAYLACHARALKAATLDRRLASISKAHEAAGYANPIRSELVKSVRRGVRRIEGIAQRGATPLVKGDLFTVAAGMGNGVRDVRDRAILLLGFAGAFRRSELVGLDAHDVELEARGATVKIRSSKTDQYRVGRTIAVCADGYTQCPVAALQGWLSVSAIKAGPIFRPIDRYGQVCHKRLSADAISEIVKQRVAAVGLDPAEYSGHSLRAGFATSADQAGVPAWKIRRQTGHASDASLSRYIRPREIFDGVQGC